MGTNSMGGEYQVSVTGAPFNDAYRYVDWLLTVPLLLIELILVMKLPEEQTTKLCWNLGTASATLVVGLGEATSKQPSATVSALVANARYLTVISWCTYPFVYIVKNIGLAGATACTYEQIGYSITDVVAKAVFGVLIWAIAAEKSSIEFPLLR